MTPLFAMLLVLAVAAPLQAPAGYEAGWRTLPLRHRQLVRSIQVDRTSGGQARRSSMSIHLTPYRGAASDRTLVHELCHIVAYASPEMERAWQQQYWPKGKPVGTPPTEYARTSPAEDWAVSCEKARDGDGPDDRSRAAFIKAWNVWP